MTATRVSSEADGCKWEPTPDQIAKVRALLRPHLARLATKRSA